MRAWAAVVDVADDVQMVDDKTLDQMAERDDTLLCPSDADDRVEDRLVVRFLGVARFAFRQQLFQDVIEALRQGLAHLGTRVLRARAARNGDQTVQRHLVPVFRILFVFQNLAHFFRGIVDECRELLLFILGERVAEDIVDFVTDASRAVAQDVRKGFVFAVDVGHEMLRALWQVADGFQVDDFFRRGGDCGVKL